MGDTDDAKKRHKKFFAAVKTLDRLSIINGPMQAILRHHYE